MSQACHLRPALVTDPLQCAKVGSQALVQSSTYAARSAKMTDKPGHGRSIPGDCFPQPPFRLRPDTHAGATPVAAQAHVSAAASPWPSSDAHAQTPKSYVRVLLRIPSYRPHLSLLCLDAVGRQTQGEHSQCCSLQGLPWLAGSGRGDWFPCTGPLLLYPFHCCPVSFLDNARQISTACCGLLAARSCPGRAPAEIMHSRGTHKGDTCA